MFTLIQLLWQGKLLIKDNTNVVFLVNMESQFLLLCGSEMTILSFNWELKNVEGAIVMNLGHS